MTRLIAEPQVRGQTYDATLLLGLVNETDGPFIGHITEIGLAESQRSGYFTAGIAAPYAELVLKDSYSPEISCYDTKLIVAGLIDAIGKVDNNVEGLDVYSIPSTRTVEPLTLAERQATREMPLSLDFTEELDEVKERVEFWDDFYKRMEAQRPPASQSETGSSGQQPYAAVAP